jgi:hypothetical protein
MEGIKSYAGGLPEGGAETELSRFRHGVCS